MSLTEARFHDLVDALQEALEDAFDASDLDLDLDARPASSFGTENRMLTMDLLRFNEDEADTTPVPERKPAETADDVLHPDMLEFEPGLYKKTT